MPKVLKVTTAIVAALITYQLFLSQSSWLSFLTFTVIFGILIANNKSRFSGTLDLFQASLFWAPLTYTLVFAVGAYYGEAIQSLYHHVKGQDKWLLAFVGLFIFKFLRFVVHLVSFLIYTPTPFPMYPTYSSRDCTVILPTIGDMDEEFIECVRTILANDPLEIIISTIKCKASLAHKVVSIIDDSENRIRVRSIQDADKRQQVMTAVQECQGRIVATADDHVFWKPTLLQSALAPFEDPSVGQVGVPKRVRRLSNPTSKLEDFLNFIAALYLERHNFDCTSSSNLDGAVFVISGRTQLIRASILQDANFHHAFTNEYFLGRGPLNCDDDNFITRWMVKHDFKTVFHNKDDALMETTLGETGGYTKFWGQLLRWARTTVRSNTRILLLERKVFSTQPWAVYAVYLYLLLNFALFYECALLFCLAKSPLGSKEAIWGVVGLLLASKLVKPFPHYWRRPCDLVWLPGQILFGYFHSVVKLWALVTCWETGWGTRAGVK